VIYVDPTTPLHYHYRLKKIWSKLLKHIQYLSISNLTSVNRLNITNAEGLDAINWFHLYLLAMSDAFSSTISVTKANFPVFVSMLNL